MYAHDCVHILPTSYLRVIIIHNLGKYRKRKVHTGWKPKESILVFLHQNVETEFPRNDILHKETIQLQISDHWITNTLLMHICILSWFWSATKLYDIDSRSYCNMNHNTKWPWSSIPLQFQFHSVRNRCWQHKTFWRQ
mgnify:CR=1 FL=1